jgi:hypothetical protein
MPSYAHYYQTLIPHMPVPPGSIHLHKHSPSVLTSLSGPRNRPDQEVSEPEAGAGHSLEETSSNNFHLPHLERDHTQAQSQLALAIKPRAVQLCVVTIANWKYKHDLSNRLNNGSRPHSDGSQECMMSNSRRGRHRLHDSERRVKLALQKQT